MGRLWPFFTFYGGKWRCAPRYPPPTETRIIEPFAGSAGYSVRYPLANIILVEKDPVIASVWKFLINSSYSDIARLPLIGMDESVDDLKICQEAKYLIGFWLNKATASPCKTPGAWMREGLRPKSFWGPEIRSRIAAQVTYIGHWRIIEGDYTYSPHVRGTWFIDPPYSLAGKLYKMSSRGINYPQLAKWCIDRPGQVLVCENQGATWLPFQPHITIKSTEGSRGKGNSKEVLYQRWNP